MKKLYIYRQKIVAFLGALILVAFVSVATVTGIPTSANATSIDNNTLIVNPEPDCICAERRNWLGKCRGSTHLVCEGDLGCQDVCG